MASIKVDEQSDSATESEHYSDDEYTTAVTGSAASRRTVPAYSPQTSICSASDQKVKHESHLPVGMASLPPVASKCPGCYRLLQPYPVAASSNCTAYCDCCESVISDDWLENVRSEDGFSTCEACEKTRQQSNHQYEESLDLRPDEDWMEALHLSCIHLERAISLPGNAEAAAAKEEVDRLCTERKLLEARVDAAMDAPLAVALARALYSEHLALEKNLLAALSRYGRMLFTAIVAHVKMIPHDFVEVAMAVFIGEKTTAAMDEAVKNALVAKERDGQSMRALEMMDLLPKMAPTPCTNCKATLQHQSIRTNKFRAVYLEYCDCCQRMAPCSLTQKPYSGRVCASCERGDPTVLAELKAPPRFMKSPQYAKQFVKVINLLVSSVPRVHKGADDPRRKQLEDTFASYCAISKQLRTSHRTCYRQAQCSIELSRAKYQEQVEMERGLSTAMVELGEFLLDQAAKQGLPSTKNLSNAAKMLYPRGAAPDHVNVYLSPAHKAKIVAALVTPAQLTSGVSFCDCCERVVSPSAIAQKVPGDGTLICASCAATDTTTRGVATKRAGLEWLLSLSGRFQSLRDLLHNQIRAVVDPVTLAKIPSARLQSIEQEVQSLKDRRKKLVTKQKKAAAKGIAAPVSRQSLYTDEVSYCSDLLVVYQDFLEALVEASVALDISGNAMDRITAAITFLREKFDAYERKMAAKMPIEVSGGTSSDTRPQREAAAVPAQPQGYEDAQTRKRPRSRSRSRERSPHRHTQRMRDGDTYDRPRDGSRDQEHRNSRDTSSYRDSYHDYDRFRDFDYDPRYDHHGSRY